MSLLYSSSYHSIRFWQNQADTTTVHPSGGKNPHLSSIQIYHSRIQFGNINVHQYEQLEVALTRSRQECGVNPRAKPDDMSAVVVTCRF